MPTIVPFQPLTGEITVGQSLTITAPPVGNAYVSLLRNGGVIQSAQLRNGQSATYGPYNLDVSFKVIADQGTAKATAQDAFTTVITPPAPRGMSVAALGDSIVSKGGGFDRNGTTQAQCYAAYQRLQTSLSWLAYGAMRSGGNWFVHEFNVGGGGFTTAQILSTCLPTLLGQPYALPDMCVVEGGVNDLSSGIPVSTIVANLQAIWAGLQAAGIQPIAVTTTPRSDSTYAAAGEQLAHAIIRAAKSAGIPCADFYSTMVGTNGNCIANYIIDSVHPTSLGCSVMGYVLNQTIQGWFGTGKSIIPVFYDAAAITTQNRHPQFDTLGAGSLNTAGSYPTGWTAPTLTTTVWSTGSEPGTGRTQRVVTPQIASLAAPAYAGNSWSLQGDGTHFYTTGNQGLLPTWAIGDRLALSFQVKMITTPNPTNVLDFQLAIWDSTNNQYLFGLVGPYLSGLGQVDSAAAKAPPAYIGNETGYSAGAFYAEYTTSSNNAANLAGNGVVFSFGMQSYAGFGTATNVGDSITLANFQVVNLTKAGIL